MSTLFRSHLSKPLVLALMLFIASTATAQTQIELFNNVIYPALKGVGATTGTFGCGDPYITCNGQSEIIYVLFKQAQLSGNIPTEVALLTSLQKLELWENQLFGPIPSEIGQLGELEDLELQFNLLDGEIPTELGMARKISTLNLQSNRLGGSVPQELIALELIVLSVTRNRLCGELPTLNVTGSCYAFNDYQYPDFNCFACDNDQVINPNNCQVRTTFDCACQCLSYFTPQITTVAEASTTAAGPGATTTNAASSAPVVSVSSMEMAATTTQVVSTSAVAGATTSMSATEESVEPTGEEAVSTKVVSGVGVMCVNQFMMMVVMIVGLVLMY